MKSFKKYLLSAVLSLSSLVAVSANATEWRSSFFVPPVFGPDLVQVFNFGNMPGGDDGNGGFTTALSGDTFIDDFIFSTPPDRSFLNFWAESDFSSIAFSGFGLYSVADGSPIQNFGILLSTEDLLNGIAYIESGVYDLRIFGTVLIDSGSYTAFASADIPEPSVVFLMLAGLLVVAGLKMRQNKQA